MQHHREDVLVVRWGFLDGDSSGWQSPRPISQLLKLKIKQN